MQCATDIRKHALRKLALSLSVATGIALVTAGLLDGAFGAAAAGQQTAGQALHVAVVYMTHDGMLLFRTPSPRPATDTPAGDALVLAESLLGRLALPAGARVTLSDPSAGDRLGGAAPPMYPATLELVEGYRFWRLPGTPQAVMAWLQAHRPAGSTVTEFSTAGPPEVTLSFPIEPDKTGLEWLELSAGPARGGGTALRASAVVEWLPPRPQEEHIPSGVRAVSIAASYPSKHINLTRSVTAPALVQRIIATVEALPRTTYGISSCGAVRLGELSVSLAFRRTLAGAPVAKVVASGSSCGAVTMWVAGHKMPPLSDPTRLINTIQSILKTRL